MTNSFGNAQLYTGKGWASHHLAYFILQAKAVLYNTFVWKLLASTKHPVTSHVQQLAQKEPVLHIFIVSKDKAWDCEDLRETRGEQNLHWQDAF